MDYGNSAKFKDFSFCLTRDLDLCLSVKISNLEGHRTSSTFSEILEQPSLRFSGVNLEKRSDVYVTCQLFSKGEPLTLQLRTAYKCFKNHWTWNEWLTFPLKIRDLPRDAQIVFTVWDILKPGTIIPVGGTTLVLFTKNNTLRKGKQKLYLWLDMEGDGSVKSSTPGKQFEKDEMDRLEKLVKKQESGDIPRVDWLDKLAFREIESLHQKQAATSKKMFLYVDLPKFDFPLVFSEPEAVLPIPFDLNDSSSLIVINDLEIYRENPVEAKHRRLVRSHRSGPLDRELKPNARHRDELNKILKYPPTQTLTAEEKDLLWKFRFYLTRDKKALTKFLKCVIWTDSTEAKQAEELINLWADIDVDDALELLGSKFENPSVRAYAVNQLKKAADDELLLHLLQLVQALKFDKVQSKQVQPSYLAEFLINRSLENPVLGNWFHWYLMSECGDKAYHKMYGKISYQYMTAMMELPNGHERRETLRLQGQLVESILALSKEVRKSKDPRPKKIDKFRAALSDPKKQLISFAPMRLPLDPNVMVSGVIPEKSTIFKSNMLPLKLTFLREDQNEYPSMFKYGDDLRQDQLVIQIIMLMDNLLRKENLDLKLTPYKVLATGSGQGFIQFIPSMSLASILSENNNSLLLYLRKNNPNSSAPYGVDSTVMDTYLRSCAGYCVITYLLGVGDRHLDNLLVTSDGRLFHIDFGFILGRDPKPFPPPMKLCKEMVEAMGGATSPHYAKFKSYCYVAFNGLRKSANLILNLLSLMVDANIPDIAIEPDKAVMKVQEKFCLELTDEEAIQHFQGLINDSVSALFPQVIETIHKWAQYWRK